ncbi:hypothetical protein SAMN05216349_1564 [Oribacterium sp. KHPX15]|uniref:hypothetical protein n=1 Tax=Oribacterium sp. KHPX15 TaxID=1855342 RepID=UPI000898F1B8|nr:hypothetical protein [Oribacterium sp. KHPX15]SEA92840.1 hypothetical protein SAMN05216349_1564 [Oribacterium sp. KHPX15]
MEIVKNGKTYDVMETARKWRIKDQRGKVYISYEVSQKDCATIEDLQKYVDEINILN